MYKTYSSGLVLNLGLQQRMGSLFTVQTINTSGVKKTGCHDLTVLMERRCLWLFSFGDTIIA